MLRFAQRPESHPQAALEAATHLFQPVFLTEENTEIAELLDI